MAATSGLTRLWRRLLQTLASVLGGVLAVGSARAVDLPTDTAEGLMHVYDGGGVRATGPALLVRKSLLDKVSLTGTYYVDMVSNASIDVVTTASPYKEKRTELGLGLDYAYRDSLMTLSTTSSDEPDYKSKSVSVDVANDVFGGMTTVALGFSRGADEVGRRSDPGFSDSVETWKYRLGLTQILTPRWLLSANSEVVADHGHLGSPYRSARVFGAAVLERVPRTRSSRAVKLRLTGDVGAGTALHAEYRYFWDTWAIKAHTMKLGASRHFGESVLADAYLRYYAQKGAVFYSDNATSETLYVSRNRQLGDYQSVGLGAKVAYTLRKVPGKYELKLNGAYELTHFKFNNFTDVRSGALYRYRANVLQLFLSTPF